MSSEWAPQPLASESLEHPFPTVNTVVTVNKETMKNEILNLFIAHLESELKALIQSAKSAHLAATHEESRAEDKHDTFAIEASYLAAGQAARVVALREALTELRGFLELQSATPPTRVAVGALLTLNCEENVTHVLIARSGGGTRILYQGTPITILSPASPLGEQLQGLGVNDEANLEHPTHSKTYLIEAIL